MTMSHDRVKFFLGSQYTPNEIARCLDSAFDIKRQEFEKMRQANHEGFWIICRPSQFARFLIHRDEAGLRNGFKDLRAELVLGPDCVGDTVDVGTRKYSPAGRRYS